MMVRDRKWPEGLPLPLDVQRARESLEDALPGLAELGLGCSVVAALVDELSPATARPQSLRVPGADRPIMGFADGDADSSEMLTDTWAARGTVLLADGGYLVLGLILELSRRPEDTCWHASVMVKPIPLSLSRYLEQLEMEALAA